MTDRTRGRGRSEPADRGAAAVEFALVMPILFALVFAIIDYGLLFDNSLSTRQGVREGARMGVVENFDPDGSCSTGQQLQRLACTTDQQIGAVAGTAYTKVVVGSWAEREPLKVCSMVKTTGLTGGLVPLPAGGIVRSQTQMSIESAESPPTQTVYAETLPAGFGADWSWCR